MSSVIANKDLMILRRESVMKALLAVGVMLLLASLLAGLQRESVYDKERTAAAQTDEAVWMGQGERNPHSAAHFSRYAFRPASPLALIDPGTSDFAGLAVWMEAHYQDPAVFRRAEDGGELSRYTALTPAFLMITAAPLIVFLMLYGSIAGEREDGTLRQLLASGVSGREFFAGKFFAGLRLTLIAFAVVFAALAIFSLVTTPADVSGDTVVRLAGLFVTFSVYLAICVAVAIGASALFRSRQAAFLALAGFWVLMTVLMPRLAADIGTSVHAQPDPRAVTEQLSAASSTYSADEARQREVESGLLEEYGVSSLDELPFNFGAYRLQISEEASLPAFERVYGGLDDVYGSQEGVAKGFSLLTPAIATASLSRGLAGTDRVHQREFTIAAEEHRREMIKMLNEDYRDNAGAKGSAYAADAELWEQFEELDHTLPSLAGVGGAYATDALVLLAWLFAAFIAARALVARAIQREVPTA